MIELAYTDLIKGEYHGAAKAHFGIDNARHFSGPISNQINMKAIKVARSTIQELCLEPDANPQLQRIATEGLRADEIGMCETKLFRDTLTELAKRKGLKHSAKGVCQSRSMVPNRTRA